MNGTTSATYLLMLNVGIARVDYAHNREQLERYGSTGIIPVFRFRHVITMNEYNRNRMESDDLTRRRRYDDTQDGDRGIPQA